MPRQPRFTAETYWEAYGPLKRAGYVPTLSLVGAARAMGVRQSNRVLGAYAYLVAHSVCGDWLADEGSSAYNLSYYEALLEFLSRDPVLQLAWHDDPVFDEEALPKHLRDAEPVAQLAYFTSVVSATHAQVGSMYPDQTESSRPKTAGRALKRLEEAKVIERVYRGSPGKASLYVFLPVVCVDVCPQTWHWWGDEYELDDFGVDYADFKGKRAPEWPWPDDTRRSTRE